MSNGTNARKPSLRRGVLLGSSLALAVLLVWARGLPVFVGWEIARDHERCGHTRLRARLFTNEPGDARQWLESHGTPVQPLPARAGELTLLGVRYCPLSDRIAAHVFYGGEKGYASVFVLSGPARVGDGWQGEYGPLRVRLLRSAGRTLAIVGSSNAAVDALTRAFRSSVASLPVARAGGPSLAS